VSCWICNTPSLWNICVTNDHGYVLLVVSTSRSFPNSWLITGFVTRSTRRVPLVEQAGTAHPSGAPEFTLSFLWGSCYSIFSFIWMFCRSLFVLLYFFFWPLYCLFSDIRILITPFVSSNSSFNAILFLHFNVQISPFSCH
jgi:hypothetical protein